MCGAGKMRHIDDILKEAVEKRASDVHVTAGRPVCIRVDGVLKKLDGEELNPEMIEELLKPLWAYAKGSWEQMERDGEADFAYHIPDVGRFRVNVFRQRGSLAMVMRILPVNIPHPRDLSIPEAVLEMAHRPRGLVLVTGATGSGKSTTLASMINIVNQTYPKHIITLEDPIEYLHTHAVANVNQRELGSDTKSYAVALRAALRQDPDVILVGEMRDLETISTAITAAETGHLVFSTLHTNGAADAIDRMIDVFPPHQQQQVRIQLATVLECIVFQQLLPRAGGKGRAAAFEVLIANAAIRNLIRENKTYQINSTLQTNHKLGMQTMDDALYDLAMQGIVTAENALARAYDYEAMKKKLMI
jgi:twitching motility protein PilT